MCSTVYRCRGSGVHQSTRRGELPAFQIGGRGQWRIQRAKLEAYIEQAYLEQAERRRVGTDADDVEERHA